MIPSEGYAKAEKGHVCKFVKSLYRLKQASRQWNKEFTSKLLSIGFKQSTTNNYLFNRGTSYSFVALLVYVDGVLLSSPSQA